MTSAIASTNNFTPLQRWIPVSRDSQQSVDESKQSNAFRHNRVHDHGTTQETAGHEHQRAVNQVDNNTQINDPAQAAGAAIALQGISASVSSAFDMQITTKEGDVVTIGFNTNASHTKSAMQVQDASGQRMGTDEENTQSSNFNISVQGNLSEAEQKSLADLMQQIQKVGSSFFSGQTQNAFQQAQNVGFDAGQIAGFSMGMNLEMSVQAISAYQQNNQDISIDPSALRQMAGFFNQSLSDLSNAPQALQPFADPLDLFNSLGQGITDVVAGQAQQSSAEQQPLDMLQQLIKMAGNILFGDNNASAQQADVTPAPASPVQEPINETSTTPSTDYVGKVTNPFAAAFASTADTNIKG